MTAPHSSFASLSGIDWNDTDSILAGCTPVFDAMSTDRALLASLICKTADDPTLAEMCEGFDFMRKLVLYDDPTHGVRVRLHLYRGGFFDRPHNHRWSFASRILHGSYQHRIFGPDSDFDEATDPNALRPLLTRHEQPGHTYALHHTSVHTVSAATNTASLLIRGPAAKQRFLIHDAAANEFFWVRGAQQETPDQRERKQLTPTELAGAIDAAQTLLTT
ncbi:hypothetical protein [Nocardia sp. CNY236]|uniref:hypothetical protein n=1 Tax=Nocardia sp. CNY236 TaxID=1169152 RepID=UPI00041727CD|nr:hypothetical protein [Nocardia sp. CNY236]